MIHQDDNMGFMEQLKDALVFLKQNEETTQKELDQINFSIKNFEEELSRINKDIAEIVNNYSNTDLFIPGAVKVREDSVRVLKQNKSELEVKLKNAEESFLYHINRKNSLDNLMNCFYTLKSNSIEDPNAAKDHPCSNDNIVNLEMGISVLETQENERKRIARDLHDSTVQNLTNMMHKTELCTRLIDIDPIRAKLELQTMISTIKTTINDMRNIIFGLRPMSLDDLGLIATIERYIRDLTKNHDVDIALQINAEEKRILPIINLTLFRIVQEACNNAIKHGKAKKIVIKIEYEEEGILLSINDNGLGFEESTYKEAKANIFSGYGLSMMKERIIILTGEFDIQSKKNEGTTIRVKVPLNTTRRVYK